MKRFLPKMIVIAILLIGGLYLTREEEVTISDIALDNVEALAAGEGGWGRWHCLGSGSLDCPDGRKVEFIVENYSLD